MTKGGAMISDLKSRTLSLFRRSSASSTQSASSTRSSSDQQGSSATVSPTLLRKRPSSNRSRSSLIVPRVRSAVVDNSVTEDVQREREEEEQQENSQRDGSPPQLQTRTFDISDHSPTTRSDLTPQKHQNIPLQSLRQPSVSSPLPLPTPEPSPLHQPDLAEEIASETDAPQLNLQPSTPDGLKPAQLPSDIKQPSTTTTTTAAEPLRNPKLDLAGRPRSSSAGKRSLLDSRPRSPLHQSLLPGQVEGASKSQASPSAPGAATAAAAVSNQSGQSPGRPSQDLEPADYFSSLPGSPRSARTPPAMAHSPGRYPSHYSPMQQQQQPRRRKIWVKRPGASATMVAINEDDMVDDARDMILRKYANSLGKAFDSPDVMLRIHPREQPVSASARSSSAQVTPSPLMDERSLRPDEILCRTIDVYFPGGQSVEEALIIDTPQPQISQRSRRTPRHSPGVHTATHFGIYGAQPEDLRPTESDKDYFPPMMVTQPNSMSGAPSPRIVGTLPVVGGHPHSIAVLNNGQLPALPSPRELVREGIAIPAASEGGKRRHGEHRRPKFGRQHTSSPTIVQHGDQRQPIPPGSVSQAPALSTPPHPSTASVPAARVATPPPPRVSSPRPKAKRGKKPSMSGSISGLGVSQANGMLASVPPINVLVVEDNIINLKLLEAFLKRLKVRSHSAKDGREAVAKWREGGFHLVLMDIQLPLMNGLEATKEIRRLERVNGVGAFVKTAAEEKLEKKRPENASADGSEDTVTKDDEEEKEKEKERNRIGKKELFKSPVIIVALTASSLHSDRSEALAAGCNDFLTKPVNLTWLERKLKEWGCMQALIDFDGWRQWKEFQSPAPLSGPSPKIAQTPLKRSQLSVTTSSSSKNTLKDSPGMASPSKQPPSRSNTGGMRKGNVQTNGQNDALQDLAAKTESAESTTTLDSMTSDDADSFDTAMPSRPDGRPLSPHSAAGSLSPSAGAGPTFLVQAPTPRQSTDGGVPQSPRIRSPTQDSADGSEDGNSERTATSGGSRRRKRGSSGLTNHARVLSAVGEESESSQSMQNEDRSESGRHRIANGA